MQRRHLAGLMIGALLTLLSSLPARALRPISAAEAPKADSKLLRAVNAGAQEIPVIIGVKDGTPPARALIAAPDPAGEPARRVGRLAAQKRLVGEAPRREFRVRHFYESFSLLAGE